MPPHKFNEHMVPHFGGAVANSNAKKTFVDSDDDNDTAVPQPPPPPKVETTAAKATNVPFAANTSTKPTSRGNFSHENTSNNFNSNNGGGNFRNQQQANFAKTTSGVTTNSSTSFASATKPINEVSSAATTAAAAAPPAFSSPPRSFSGGGNDVADAPPTVAPAVVKRGVGPVDQHAAKNALPPTTKFNTVHHFGGEPSNVNKVKFDDSDDDGEEEDKTIRRAPPQQQQQQSTSTATNSYHAKRFGGGGGSGDAAHPPSYGNADNQNNSNTNNGGGEAFKRRRVEGGAESNNTANSNNGSTYQQQPNKPWKERKPPSAAALSVAIPLPPPILEVPSVETFIRAYYPKQMLKDLLLGEEEEEDNDDDDEKQQAEYKALKKFAKNTTRLGVWASDEEDEENDETEKAKKKKDTEHEKKKHSTLLSTVLSLTRHTARRCRGIIGEMNKLNNPRYVIPKEEDDDENENEKKGNGEENDNFAGGDNENGDGGEEDGGYVGWGDLNAAIGGNDASDPSYVYHFADTPSPNMRCAFKKRLLNRLTRANKAMVLAAVSFVEVFYPRLIMMMQLQHEYGDHYTNQVAAAIATNNNGGSNDGNSSSAAAKKEKEQKKTETDAILGKLLKPHTHPILVARLPALVKRRLELYGRYGLLGASAAAAAAAAAVTAAPSTTSSNARRKKKEGAVEDDSKPAPAAAPAATAASSNSSGNYSNEEVRSILLFDDEDPEIAERGVDVGEDKNNENDDNTNSESVLLTTIKKLFDASETVKLCKTFNMTFALTTTPIAKAKEVETAAETGDAAVPPMATTEIVSYLNGLVRISKKDREEARLRGEMAALMTKEDSSRICIVSHAVGGKKKMKKSKKATDAVSTYLGTFSTEYMSTPKGPVILFNAKPVTAPTITTKNANGEEEEKPLPPSQRYLMQLPVPTAVGAILRVCGVSSDAFGGDEEAIKEAKSAFEDAMAPLVTMQQQSRKVFPRIVVVE